MTICAGGPLKSILVRLFVAREAIRPEFEIAARLVAFIAFQNGMFAGKWKTSVFMIEHRGLQQLFLYYSVLSTLVVGMAFETLAAYYNVISLFSSEPLPDFPVAIQAFFIRDTTSQVMTLQAVIIIFCVKCCQRTGAEH